MPQSRLCHTFNVWSMATILVLCLFGIFRNWPFFNFVVLMALILRVLKVKDTRLFLIASLAVYAYADQNLTQSSENFKGLGSPTLFGGSLVFNYNVLEIIGFYLGNLLIFFSMFKLLKKIISDAGVRTIVATVIFFTLLLVSKQYFKSGLPLGYTAIAFALVGTKIFNYFLYCLNSSDDNISFLQFSTYVTPSFWDISLIPRPVLNLDKWHSNKYQEDRLAFKYALSAFIGFFCTSIIGSLVWKYNFFGLENINLFPTLPDIMTLGTSLVMEIHSSRLELMASMILRAVYYIVNYTMTGLALDAMYLFLGFKGPLHFYNPLKAKTFGEFVACIMPYYVTFVTTIYIVPLYKHLKKVISNKQIAHRIALVFGITVGGIFYHLIRDFSFLLKYPTDRLLSHNIINGIVYFGSLGLLSIFYQFFLPNYSRITRVAIFSSWILMYSLVYSFRSYVNVFDISEKMKFYMYLFGGG